MLVSFPPSGVIVVNALKNKLSHKQLMEGGDCGVNGPRALVPAEEECDSRKDIVIAQRKCPKILKLH